MKQTKAERDSAGARRKPMTPISPVLLGVVDLPEVIIAKDQPVYIPLPALISHAEGGMITTRWRLTWHERLKVLWSGNLWLQMMCFHKPVTPVKLSTDQPPIEECL